MTVPAAPSFGALTRTTEYAVLCQEGKTVHDGPFKTLQRVEMQRDFLNRQGLRCGPHFVASRERIVTSWTAL